MIYILKNVVTLGFYVTIYSCNQEETNNVAKYVLKQGMVSDEILIMRGYEYGLKSG
jgi:hypothetical protein